jgi:hypothetical protein
MFLNFVNAINAVRGEVWLMLFVTTAMFLLYARYHKTAPSGNLVESFNSIHPAVYGFVLCMMGVVLELNGHEQAGDKVFLSGASFIGGVAMRASYNGNGAAAAIAAAQSNTSMLDAGTPTGGQLKP